MQQSQTGKRAVRSAGTAVLALAFATLAVVAGSRPADAANAASETIDIGRNVGSTIYYLSTVPSSASRCHLDDRLHPVTGPAMRTFKKVLDPHASIASVVHFTCKGQIYASEAGSCSVFRLTGCECLAGCL